MASKRQATAAYIEASLRDTEQIAMTYRCNHEAASAIIPWDEADWENERRAIEQQRENEHTQAHIWHAVIDRQIIIESSGIRQRNKSTRARRLRACEREREALYGVENELISVCRGRVRSLYWQFWTVAEYRSVWTQAGSMMHCLGKREHLQPMFDHPSSLPACGVWGCSGEELRKIVVYFCVCIFTIFFLDSFWTLFFFLEAPGQRFYSVRS